MPGRLVGVRRSLRYRFDNLLSRGTWPVLLWLGAATLLTILLSSLLLSLFAVRLGGSADGSWLEDFWQSMLRVLDPGTMAGDVGWGRRVLALLVTMFGILIAGTLIGIIAAGVERRIEMMQRGRSAVVESDHVVILGASPRLPVLVEQLALAGRNRPRNVIVVLADREPTELSQEVRAGRPDLHGARLVFRWGDPTSVADLAIVSLETARSLIVLADDESDDAGAVLAVLAVGSLLGGFDAVPTVVELRDPENARSLSLACGGAVDTISPAQAVARLATFGLTGPGLVHVILELLDFRGPDLYVREPGDLVGSTFGDSVLAFPNATPIGLMSGADEVMLNPDRNLVVDESHRLIVIADDDSTAAVAPQAGRWSAPPISRASSVPAAAPTPQHVLVVGWSPLGRQLIEELDSHAVPGSSVQLVHDPHLLDEDVDLSFCQAMTTTITASSARTVHLDSFDDPARLTAIFLLGYRAGLSPREADGRTLLNLMVVNRELASRGLAPRVVVQMLDATAVELATLTGVDDFVVSDAIASRLIAQLSELPARRAVLLELYDTDDSAVRLVDPGVLGVSGDVRFDQIVELAYSVGLLAIGWRLVDTAGGASGGVELNPPHDRRAVLGPADRIVVID